MNNQELKQAIRKIELEIELTKINIDECEYSLKCLKKEYQLVEEAEYKAHINRNIELTNDKLNLLNFKLETLEKRLLEIENKKI